MNVIRHSFKEQPGHLRDVAVPRSRGADPAAQASISDSYIIVVIRLVVAHQDVAQVVNGNIGKQA